MRTTFTSRRLKLGMKLLSIGLIMFTSFILFIAMCCVGSRMLILRDNTRYYSTETITWDEETTASYYNSFAEYYAYIDAIKLANYAYNHPILYCVTALTAFGLTVYLFGICYSIVFQKIKKRKRRIYLVTNFFRKPISEKMTENEKEAREFTNDLLANYLDS